MARHSRRALVQYSIFYYVCVTTLINSGNASDIIHKLPYGHPCVSDGECRDQFHGGSSILSYLGDDESECQNGRCGCNEFIQFRVFGKGNYWCAKGYGSRSNIGKCSLGDSNSCIDGTCRRKFIDYMCYCSDGFVLVVNTCRRTSRVKHSADCKTLASGRVPICDYKNLMHCDKDDIKCVCFKDLFYDREAETCIKANLYAEKYPNETLAGLEDFCGTKNNLPKVCDEDANMSCDNSTCKCKREFYPVQSNGTCESKQSFAEANNLTSYKVMPGDYCYNDDDCITGLDCFKNVCACPYPCTYDNKTLTCDCGEVSSTEGAANAILVGILGGLVIIIFWCRMIKKTIHKGKEKSKFNRNSEGVTSDLLPDTGQSYTHQPLPYNTTTDYPLTPITSDTTNNTRSFFSPPPAYPTTFDSTTNYNPTPPPAYSTTTDSTTNPIAGTPYPLNPVAGTPYSLNPVADTPYPHNPVVDTPYPLNPVADTSYPHNPVADTPYPHNPVVDTPYPHNPTHVTGSVSSSVPNSNNSAIPISPPPPYTPTTRNDPSAPPVMDIYTPIIS